ncbi:probable mannitol dehydrogenase [Phalaenopsis equestris]|uniref:probable mannitol dehydrogenase n=1 Tax=Phalaenopsis equestris TaxID=78828 RepID=UPI0009E1F638|nr:probable mannitol dehydrogenase [Phalaenopsis equestris]
MAMLLRLMAMSGPGDGDWDSASGSDSEATSRLNLSDVKITPSAIAGWRLDGHAAEIDYSFHYVLRLCNAVRHLKSSWKYKYKSGDICQSIRTEAANLTQPYTSITAVSELADLQAEMAAEKKTSTHHKAFGWAARDNSGILSPFNFTRRGTGESDVRIKILYCGICHGDLHQSKQDIDFPVTYPLIPGHEIIGEMVEAGDKVKKFKAGDKAGVGCFVRICGDCEQCKESLESYCHRAVMTYNATDYDGSPTYGGYSDTIVVDERYVFRIPDRLPLHSTAPLLCAGITVYSPMRYFGLDQSGLHVGVVGLGGLGHMAVKFAKAMKMKVMVISTSPHKQKEAIEILGADQFLLSTNEQQIKAAAGSLDGIIDTVSAYHLIEPLLGLLKAHGKLVVLGASKEQLQVPSIPLLLGRKMKR